MKQLTILFLGLFLLLLNARAVQSQVDLLTFTPEPGVKYLVEKNDGTVFFGEILSYDAREVLIKTTDKGEIILPKYELNSISLADDVQLDSSGKFITEDRFATRYFITTNGLPIKKGEHYVQWNLFGPDFQFAVSDNFGLGVMTSWLAVPIIGSAKYTIPLGGNTNLALGALLGTFAWADANSGLALPFLTISQGNRRSNLSLSGGYGVAIIDGESEGRTLISIAGMHRVSNSISLVFDSFIGPAFNSDKTGYALLIPGIRWQRNNRSAFQFGFAGVIVDGEIIPAPIPMVQWFNRINW